MYGSFPGREMEGSCSVGTEHHQGADESIRGRTQSSILLEVEEEEQGCYLSDSSVVWGQYLKMLLLLLLLGPSMNLIIWVASASVHVCCHEWIDGQRLWSF